MRPTRLLLLTGLLASSAALAQSNVRISYEFAVPTHETKDFIDRFSSRGAHLDVSLELSYAFNLELSAGLNSFNAVKQGLLTTTDGQDVSGKQFRYLNVIPLMGGFAWHIPLGHGSRLWAGVNGGAAYFDRVIDVGLNEYTASDWQWGVQPHVGIAFGLDKGTALFFDGRWNYFWERHGMPAQQYFSFGVGLLFGGSGNGSAKSSSTHK
ncbi:MAG TPA: hypothetical protein VMH40_15640 [Myxococcaceae bacterium]|nr:hypothetical protein [Myxococcaceae bacterium]